MMKKQLRALVCAALTVSILAGCGGGSVTPTAQPQPSHGTSGKPGVANFVIKIPSKAAAVRAPHYVSASTASISIAIAPGANCSGCSQATTINANLTPNTPTCPTVSGSTTCTLP